MAKPSGKVSTKPWGDITASDYPDAGAYCDACLINENTGPRSHDARRASATPRGGPTDARNTSTRSGHRAAERAQARRT